MPIRDPAQQVEALLQQWERSGRRLSPEELCASRQDLLPALRQSIHSLSQVKAATQNPAPLGRPAAGRSQPTGPGGALKGPSSRTFSVTGQPVPAASSPKAATPGSVANSAETMAAPRSPAPAASPRVEGFEILHRLGQGGMGEVWSAIQLSTRRRVALKLMGAAGLGAAEARARFTREVELAAALEHPHIGRIYDSGLHRGGYYYAMELIAGVPLDQHVRERQLSQRQILQLMETVCKAVGYAHSHGVIHRDLKPSNILVSDDGQPHVLDFGLAKSTAPLSGQPQVTLSGADAIVGTPAYMSPEQAAGRHEQLDARSDVFTLGVILYLLLTGKSPHDLSGTHLEIMHRVMSGTITAPSQISRTLRGDLEVLLMKAMALRKEDRYATAAEMAQDIERYLNNQPLSARPPTLAYVLSKQVRRSKALVIAGAITMVAGGALAVALLGPWSSRGVSSNGNTTVSLAGGSPPPAQRITSSNKESREAVSSAAGVSTEGKPATRYAVTPRLRVPDSTAQAQALRVVRQRNAAAIAAATGPHEKSALAGKMFQWARKAEDTEQTYALLVLARELAAQAGDIDFVLRAGDLIKLNFETDPIKTDLWTLSLCADTPAAQPVRNSGGLLEETLRQALSAGEYGAARALAKSWRLEDWVAHSERLEGLASEASHWLAAVKDGGASQDVRISAGKYLCFVHEDWDTGLSLLHNMRLDNSRVTRAVAAELERPSDPARQLQIAEAWMAAAELQPGPVEKLNTLRRAVHWCLEALARSVGSARVAPEQRLEKLVEMGICRTVDLLPLIDVSKGRPYAWKRDGQSLLSAQANQANLPVPYRPPAEYDYIVDFKRLGGLEGTGMYLRLERVQALWIMGHSRNATASLSFASPTPFSTLSGHVHTCTAQIRKERIRIFIDGKLLYDHPADPTTLKRPPYALGDDTLLGLFAWDALYEYPAVKVIDVTGRGILAR